MLRYIHSDIVQYFRTVRFKKEWRKNNKHNSTVPQNVFDRKNVIVGNYTYGELNVKTFGTTNNMLKIGSYCSIAQNVLFLLGGEHNYYHFTTFPYRKYILGKCETEPKAKGNIVIEDDVWIGEHSIILSGVSVGRGAVIGAGSVVSKSIPPYAVFAGGKIIKYRFSDEIIDMLLKVDFSKLSKENLQEMSRHESIEASLIYLENEGLICDE